MKIILFLFAGFILIISVGGIIWAIKNSQLIYTGNTGKITSEELIKRKSLIRKAFILFAGLFIVSIYFFCKASLLPSPDWVGKLKERDELIKKERAEKEKERVAKIYGDGPVCVTNTWCHQDLHNERGAVWFDDCRDKDGNNLKELYGSRDRRCNHYEDDDDFDDRRETYKKRRRRPRYDDDEEITITIKRGSRSDEYTVERD